MKKSIALLIVLVAIAALFNTAFAKELSGEVRVLVRPDEGAVFEKYVPLFEAESGVKVVVDFVSWADITSKTLTTLASGGGGYDVVMIPSADATKLMAGGWFEPINDMIAGEEDLWLKTVVDFYSDTDGNLLGFPWYSGASHWIYNKAILDKAGVDPAGLKTWGDITAAWAKVKETQAGDFCLTPSIKYPGNFYYGWGSITKAHGGKLFDDEANILFDQDPATLKATKFYEDGAKLGYLNPAGIGLSDYETLIEYGTGKTAFMLNSTWSATQSMTNKELSSVTEDSFAMLVPGNGEFLSDTYLYAGAFGILKSSENKDAAKAFIKFITSDDAQKDHALYGGNLPTRVALFTDEDIAKSWKGYDVLSDQLNYGGFAPKIEWFDEWRMVAATAIQNVVKGEMTAEDALAWLAKETEQIKADAE